MTPHVVTLARKRLHASWGFLRALCRDDAYERYLRHHASAHSVATPPLNRREFYLREQQRKWSGISRCC